MNDARDSGHVTPDLWRRACAVLDRLSGIDPQSRTAALADACRAEGITIEEVMPFLRAEEGAERLPEQLDPAVVAGIGSRQKLRPGDRLAAYEIVGTLGAGGMGEVYKALDTRLGRTVAIKLMRSEFAGDPELQERFEREARVISQLNHPNICTLYDVGRQDELMFLVMEYVDGETLAQRLTQGALPPDLGLRYAVDLADALDRAHRQGFVHRDLKPANIMLTRTGAKLLDFGLAKLGVREATRIGSKESALTKRPTVLGTVGYMAPEQLQGKQVDNRADIFALGAVLYEMFTGRKAFEADSEAGVIAAVLHREPPPLRTLSVSLPRALEWTIATCLSKDPEERWQSAADVRHELRRMSSTLEEGPVSTTGETASVRKSSRLWLFAALGTAALILIILALRPETPPAAQPALSRFALPPPDGTRYVTMHALSPDGSRIAFATENAAGQRVLWVRALDGLTPRALTGTEGGSFPFWSPDGNFLGFFADNKLKKIALGTGAVETVCNCEAGGGGGATWSSDGAIVFSKGLVVDSLWKVAASGGAPTAFPPNAVSRAPLNVWPRFLPDGRRFLWLGAPEKPFGGLYLGDLKSNETVRLPELSGANIENAQTRGVYADGYLFFSFSRNGPLMAQRFDADQLQLQGEAVRLAETVEQTAPGRSFFDVSSDVLTYREPPADPRSVRLLWLDRTGREIASLGDANTPMALSPDSRYLMTSGGAGNRGLTRIDTASGVPTPIGIAGAAPVWSPDSQRFTFSGGINGGPGPVPSLATFSGTPITEPFARGLGGQAWPSDWSDDGRYIVGEVLNTTTFLDFWLVDMRGDSTRVRDIVRQPGNQRDARISPDGKWLAYASDDGGGGYEVYVRPFPEGAGRVRISTRGGRAPAWSREGRELLYVAPDGAMMSASVTAGAEFHADVPSALFSNAALREFFGRSAAPGRFYDVVRDGSRFVIAVPAAGPSASPIVVVLNWKRLLDGTALNRN